MRIRVRKLCKALDEDAFRPVLHHYDGPKFRLELSIAEVHDTFLIFHASRRYLFLFLKHDLLVDASLILDMVMVITS